MDSKLLKSSEAAALLGVSKGTLANWRYASHGPKWFGVGHSIKYRKSDVDEWLAKREFRSPP